MLHLEVAMFLILVLHPSHQAVNFRKGNLQVLLVSVSRRRGATCSTGGP